MASIVSYRSAQIIHDMSFLSLPSDLHPFLAIFDLEDMCAWLLRDTAHRYRADETLQYNDSIGIVGIPSSIMYRIQPFFSSRDFCSCSLPLGRTAVAQACYVNTGACESMSEAEEVVQSADRPTNFRTSMFSPRRFSIA